MRQKKHAAQVTNRLRTIKKRWRLSVNVFAIAIIATATVVATAVLSSKESSAAPYPLCETRGILFQYPSGNTHEHLIDMVTGSDVEPPESPITGRSINAIGYNVQDNFVYGWDNAAGQLVRVHADLSVDNLGLPTHVGTGVPYAGPTNSIIVGDVDENGDYWFIGGSDWYQVDLTPGSPTFKQILDSGSAAGITGSAGADWAYVPNGEGLYRVMDNAGVAELWAFDRTAKTWVPKGPLTGITGADVTIGAFYADAAGFLYASSNSTGNIWRIDVNAVTATHFSNGPASGTNDGARCAAAGIPIDFGDAPALYGTLLADNGPRHSVADINDINNTASLMLGKKIDIESDGFPGAEAKGDDTNNIDDEEGVTHIVATPGTPTALSIPVTVTNTSNQVATLAGWVDLDGDNNFETGERVTANIPANSGVATYELDFPSATFTADSFARFRLFEGVIADPQPLGSATGGEVEDVLVQVGTYQVVKSANPPSSTTISPGDTVTYTLNVTNTGLTDLLDLTLHDNLTDVLDDSTLVGSPVVEPASAGTATVDNNALQFIFTGDILTGQAVTITYAVKVNNPGALGNNSLHNRVVAVHSNCHPDIGGQTTSNPECQTEHIIEGGALADTGSSIWLSIGVVASLFIGGAALIARQVRFPFESSQR